MATTRNPARIKTDIDTKNIARMAGEGLGEGPVVGGEDVDGFVEAGGDEEGAGFAGVGFAGFGGGGGGRGVWNWG